MGDVSSGLAPCHSNHSERNRNTQASDIAPSLTSCAEPQEMIMYGLALFSSPTLKVLCHLWRMKITELLWAPMVSDWIVQDNSYGATALQLSLDSLLLVSNLLRWYGSWEVFLMVPPFWNVLTRKVHLVNALKSYHPCQILISQFFAPHPWLSCCNITEESGKGQY